MSDGEAVADACSAVVATENDGTFWEDGVAGFEERSADCKRTGVFRWAAYAVTGELFTCTFSK